MIHEGMIILMKSSETDSGAVEIHPRLCSCFADVSAN